MIVSSFGIIPVFPGIFAPLFGFVAGIMFGSIGLLVTSFVKTINHFNFFFTGVLSPMFFFSGVIFPLSELPKPLQAAAEIMPLTHAARLMRSMCLGRIGAEMLLDLLYCAVVTLVIGFFAARRLGREMTR